MKRIILLFISVFASANLRMAAITHEQCPICHKWRVDVYEGYEQTVKGRDWPMIDVYDLTQASAREWVIENVGYIQYLPTFVLMDDEKNIVHTFDGYVDAEDFFSEVEAALENQKKMAPRDGLEPPTK